METDGSTKIDYRIPLIDEVSKAGMRTHGIDQVGYIVTPGGGGEFDSSELQAQVNANSAAIADNSTDIADNSSTLSTHGNVFQNLLDEVYGGDSEALPWDLDLYSQASDAWAFEDTVPCVPSIPSSSPNTFNLKFYLVGNVFYADGHCVDVGPGTGVNTFNRYVEIVGVASTWMNLRMNDRGLTYTNNQSITLSSGTYNVRYYDNGPGWTVDFNVTVP